MPAPIAKDVVVIRGLTLPAKTMRRVTAHARTLPGAKGKKKPPRMAALRDLIERGLRDAENEFG